MWSTLLLVLWNQKHKIWIVMVTSVGKSNNIYFQHNCNSICIFYIVIIAWFMTVMVSLVFLNIWELSLQNIMFLFIVYRSKRKSSFSDWIMLAICGLIIYGIYKSCMSSGHTGYPLPNTLITIGQCFEIFRSLTKLVYRLM